MRLAGLLWVAGLGACGGRTELTWLGPGGTSPGTAGGEDSGSNDAKLSAGGTGGSTRWDAAFGGGGATTLRDAGSGTGGRDARTAGSGGRGGSDAGVDRGRFGGTGGSSASGGTGGRDASRDLARNDGTGDTDSAGGAGGTGGTVAAGGTGGATVAGGAGGSGGGTTTGGTSGTGGNSECGNGKLESSEQCDDGNTVSGDHCSSTCKFEFCGDGIVQGEALASISLVYLARSCGLAAVQDIWLILNGTEVARDHVMQSCGCEPGIVALTVTNPSFLALGKNGPNVVEVHTAAEISWAVVHYETPSGPGDIFLVDHGSNGAAEYRRPDLCANGAYQGREVGATVYLAGAEECDDGDSNGVGNDPCSITCMLP